MRYLIFLLIVLVLALTLSTAVGQRGEPCWNVKALGPLDDDELPAYSPSKYTCCYDSVLGKIKFDVADEDGWCRIIGEIDGSTVTYLMAYSEDFDEGTDSVYEYGTSGAVTNDSLILEIATGSTTGHFSKIVFSASYYQ